MSPLTCRAPSSVRLDRASELAPVLCYHRIGGPLELGVTRVARSTFERQMRALARAGWRTLTLDEFATRVQRGVVASCNELLLTFDDGYASLAEHAYPLLAELGFTATTFLITDHVGGTNTWDVRYTWRRLRHLDWSAVERWQARGFDFASHTASHARLTWLSPARASEELGRSRRTLVERLGDSAGRAVAYPFGAADERVVGLAREAGYSLGFGGAGANGSALSLPRAPVYVWDAGTVPFGVRGDAIGRAGRFVASLAHRCAVGTSWMLRLGRRPAVLLGAVLLGGAIAARTQAQTPTYLNQDLPFDQRVNDLVARMTLEEKVSQMKDVAAGVERLGIPEYNWWNEALHGVARSGLATVFPQAIGLAATWDDSLMYRMATVISDEARAKHEEYVRAGSRQRYQGLTFWSPNINLFRDPRWGRGQETYGEDPFLTGRLAVQFIRGLQGDDPKYLKTVATVKHFAVHSGPEPERHRFDAVVSERDLRESYLPHFETGIREGGAYSLMCAYNRVDGKAACGSDMLLKDILRGEWRFAGYVVSDCGAIDDMYLRHQVVQTAAEAAALGVGAGTDLDCGRVYPNLVEAVKLGLITERQIDTSVRRLFLARFKLGMFDAPDRVRWARIPYGVLDQPAHRDLARQVARESMVLLKNAGGVLPLRKDLGTLAVIGPNADQWRMLLGNYNGLPADPVTPLRGIREAVGKQTRVLFARGADLADGFPVLEVVPSAVLFTREGQQGLDVDYFTTRAMDGAPFSSARDTTLDANWHDAAPRADMNPDDFGVRWTGTFRAPRSGTYRLGLVGTVRFQLFLDDSLIVRSLYPTHDGEFPDPRLAQSEPLRLEGGRSYRVRVDGQESYGEAQLQLVWATPQETLEAEAVEAAEQADAVVLFLGLTARLEGEEMPVQIEGFRGGDRTRIDLPAPQERLLERIAALGKPTVLVLLNGSALAVNWAQEHVPAIVEAWYPGQAAGSAIADVLFGDYNPGGRLPVTFYSSVDDLPPFDDYRMAGRTYRFFRGTPLYPFGHGLSYTRFAYRNLRTSAGTLRTDGTITVRVDVQNTGGLAGAEVVQLYVRHVGSAVERPNKDLRGYRRVMLAPGETRTVEFPLAASSLAYWNGDTHGWVVEPERVRIEVGASSADIRLGKTIRIASGT